MNADKVQLTGLDLPQLIQWIKEQGEPAFRAKQIMEWLVKGYDFHEMRNLPNDLIVKLQNIAIAQPVMVLERHASQIDETEKLLFILHDRHTVEGVIMRYKHGTTLCLSTQVGCSMGCAFCASTLQGKLRDLTAGEMTGMVYLANRLVKPDKLSNIVLMGSGEPLDNYKEVVAFLRLISSKETLNIGARHISLSTCGLPDKIRALADEKMQVTLSVSLHASNDDVRKQIMPVARVYSISQVLDAARYYIEQTGRRVIFEYALIQGINDSAEHAQELASLLRGMQSHVNLIPLNDVKERNLHASSKARVEAFMSELIRLNISATIRRQLGDDIFGACGQLRVQRMAASSVNSVGDGR